MLGGELHGVEEPIAFLLVSLHDFDDGADVDRRSSTEPAVLVGVVVQDESSYHDPCEEILGFWGYPFEVVFPLQHVTADLKEENY